MCREKQDCSGPLGGTHKRKTFMYQNNQIINKRNGSGNTSRRENIEKNTINDNSKVKNRLDNVREQVN